MTVSTSCHFVKADLCKLCELEISAPRWLVSATANDAKSYALPIQVWG